MSAALFAICLVTISMLCLLCFAVAEWARCYIDRRVWDEVDQHLEVFYKLRRWAIADKANGDVPKE